MGSTRWASSMFFNGLRRGASANMPKFQDAIVP